MLIATGFWNMAVLMVPIISIIVLANRLERLRAASEAAGGPSLERMAAAVPADLWTFFFAVGVFWCGYWWALLTFCYMVVMVTLIVIYHCQ